VYRNLSELTNLDDVGMLYLEFVVTEDKLGELELCLLVLHLCLNCFLRRECTAFYCCHRPD
jgi:hypothetical protein